MRLISMLVLLCLTLPVAAQEAPASLQARILFDFESAQDIAGWHVRDLTDFAITRDWSAHGKAAAAITYHKWEEGKEQWPAVIATREAGVLPVSDFSPCDSLELDAYNPQEHAVAFSIHLRDSKGARFSSRSFTLQPRSAQTLKVPISDFAGVIDVSDVAELHLYVTRPVETFTVLVDYIRLHIDILSGAKELAAKTKELADEAAGLGSVAAGMGRESRRDIARIVALNRRVQRFLQGLSNQGPRTWNEVRQAAERLHRLDDAYARARRAMPHLRALQFAQSHRRKGFVLAVESPMKKVFLEAWRFESKFGTNYNLSAARNEHESFQVIVYPLNNSLSNVKWSLSPPRNRQGAEIPASVRLVGYVDCKQPSYKVPFTGWWPDPLLDFVTSVDEVPSNEVLPLWVTVDVPEDAAPGEYEGKLTVSADGAEPESVDFRLRVWDFAIPRNTHLRTALSFRGLSTKLYPEERIPALTRKYEDWMLREYHLNPGSIYNRQPPQWDVQRLRELMAEGLNAINLGYINAPRGADFNEAAYWRSFEQRMQKIADYLPIVDEAGARDLCYIYCFDERPASELDVVFETARRIHERFPDIEVMTTAYDKTFGMERQNGRFVDIWVPLTPHFDDNAERIAEARRAGRDIWWYICIGPKHPYANWFVEWPAIEGRLLMGAMTAKYNPGGFLYYAVNRWPLNDKVITGGPRTDWNPASYKNNNGDGSIMCAGPDGPLATIRLENIRDGIEDYEYYLLLRKLLQEKGQPESIGEVPAEVVDNLTNFTHDPAVVNAERERVAREIVRLSK